MSDEKLKPCPFCGSDEDLMFGVGSTSVFCKTCKICGPSVSDKTKEREAIKLWNQRPE